jgi:hypothetical protein
MLQKPHAQAAPVLCLLEPQGTAQINRRLSCYPDIKINSNYEAIIIGSPIEMNPAVPSLR